MATICNQYLTMLGVPHTSCFVDKLIKAHPYSGTLKGLSYLLDLYNVDSDLRKYSDKSAVLAEKGPFLAMVMGKIEIVASIGDDYVTLMRDDEPVKMAKADFLKRWSGKALFATAGKDSCEPEFRQHKRIRAVAIARKCGIPLCAAVLFLIFYIANGASHSVGATLGVVFNMVGVYACYQLLRDQLHISSAAGDAICGFLSKKGCEKIMARDVSKIFGVIGWGEVGMAYFSVSLAALLLHPSSINYLALFNAFCLPYTVWSIAYQRFVARTWCTLCVTVQILQWLLFGAYLISGAWHDIWPLHTMFFALGFSYLGALLIIDRLMPVLADAIKGRATSAKYDDLRLRPEVLEIQQRDEPAVDPISRSTALIFGDAYANPQVVIFCELASTQTAEIHRHVDSLLKKGLTVAYMFATEKPESERLARMFISLYRKTTPEETRNALKALSVKPDNADEVFKAHKIDPAAVEITDAVMEMRKWQRDSYLFATPTFIVNGRLLPPLYSLDDLIYID